MDGKKGKGVYQKKIFFAKNFQGGASWVLRAAPREAFQRPVKMKGMPIANRKGVGAMGKNRSAGGIFILAVVLFAAAVAAMMMEHRGGMMGGNREAPQLPALAAADLPAPGSAGAQLLQRFCSQCHNLPAPSLHTATEWPAVLQRMAGYMREDSGGMMMHRVEVPDAAEMTVLEDYLRDHARQAPAAGAAGGELPKAFATFCAECHAPPDPGQHSPGEWPAVVKRMEGYMAAQGKPAPSPAELQSILAYLEGNSHAPASAPAGGRTR